jgi:MFS family permease
MSSYHENQELEVLNSNSHRVVLTGSRHDDPEATPPDTPVRLTVDWDGVKDPENPLNWSYRRKWLLTGASCFMCFAVGLNALAITSASDKVDLRFGIDDTGSNTYNGYWIVTVWNAGATLAPLIGLPMMESFGVRKGYLVSFFFFTIFVIPQAVAQNYATLLVSRFISGSFGSVVQNGVANVIGDLWEEEENSLPCTLFIYSYLMGFTLAPVIGAAIISYLSWRWIFYIQLILYGILLPISYFLIAETRGNIILLSRAKRLSKSLGYTPKLTHHTQETFLRALYASTVRPLWMFTTEPVLFFFTLWSGLAIGNVFLGTQSIAQIYAANYSFSSPQAGYVQGAMAVGETIGFAICVLQNHIYARSARRNPDAPGRPIPESRLELSIPMSFLGLTGGLFVYAWTSFHDDAPWIGPAIGLALIGAGVMVIVGAVMGYLADFYGIFAGSAIAAVAAVENLLSATVPLACERMYTRLGFGWASTLLGIVALGLSFAPVVLYVKGKGLRLRSNFAERMKMH